MRTVVVLAKQPVAGKVKTRLCPPCSPVQAAELAAAALRDTFEAAALCQVERWVCVFDGDPDGLVPSRFEVIPQRTGGLDLRLADAFGDVMGDGSGPTVLIAMDTPQVTPVLLDQAFAALENYDAVIGPTDDGGYWTIGVHRADRAIFEGVPMSTDATGEAQIDRLRSLGHRVNILPTIRDLDTASDIAIVTREYPHLHTSKVWASFGFV